MGLTGKWVEVNGATNGATNGERRDTRSIRVVVKYVRGTVYFDDIRGFGKWIPISKARYNEYLTELGPDILDTSAAELAKRFEFSGSRRLIDALLDQRIVAGIGNYLRAEAIYLAGISDPVDAKVADVDILSLMKAVKKVAIEAYKGKWKMNVYRQPDALTAKVSGRTFYYKQN